MPKRMLQDMVEVKPSRKVTSIKKPRLKKSLIRRAPEGAESPVEEVDHYETRSGKKGNGGRKHTLWFVALISVIFFLFSLSYLFSKTVVTVNPKVKDITLNENFSADKNSNVGALSFDLVVISGEENKTIQTTEEKDFLQKAEGIVIIYNTFSSSSQTLDIDTRLDGSNGKLYKTKKKVVVPGKTADGDPGSVEIGIYAAEAGGDYNSEPLDFKIVGFKGLPKYSKFYGRSKGSISGGVKGKFPFISDTQKVSIMSELKVALQTKLVNKVTDQIPDGFVLFRDAVFLDADDNNIDFTAAKDGILPIKLKGTLYGLLFDESKLTKKIAESSVDQYDGSEVYIQNIRNLTFSLSNTDEISFGDVKKINFGLSGPAKIVWELDTDKLRSDLLGRSKKDFSQVLLQYTNVDSADLSVSPFWKMSLPDKAKDIEIIVGDSR